MRLPLPFELHADPVNGVYQVVQDGFGLQKGDVLRAFTTLSLRYDSEVGEVRFGEGLPGVGGRRRKRGFFIPGFMNSATSPAKCLFIADGQPYSRMEDALVANQSEKTRDIVMIFERPGQQPASR